MKKKLITTLATLIPLFLIAQPNIRSYADVGTNNVTKGIYLNVALIPSYTYKNFKVETGGLLNYSNRAETLFRSFYAGASVQIFVKKKINFNVEGQYCRSFASAELRETNWALLLGYINKHLDLKLGYNFRTWKLSRKTIRETGIEDYRTHETFNILYRIAYFIKPMRNQWNLGFGLCNYDYFLYQQVVNPIINIKFVYKPNLNLGIFAESWYKSAGFMNLSVNYFSYFFRTGITWDIKKKSQ